MSGDPTWLAAWRVDTCFHGPGLTSLACSSSWWPECITSAEPQQFGVPWLHASPWPSRLASILVGTSSPSPLSSEGYSCIGEDPRAPDGERKTRAAHRVRGSMPRSRSAVPARTFPSRSRSHLEPACASMIRDVVWMRGGWGWDTVRACCTCAGPVGGCSCVQHPLHSTHARVGGLVGVLVGGLVCGYCTWVGG